MIRFSDIRGNPVMDTSTATSVGKVAAPIVDPVVGRLAGFRIKRSKGPGDVLLWESVAGLGPDAITVDSAERVAQPPPELRERSEKGLDLIGRRVLTENGHDLGTVKDLEFDQADGSITSLILKNQYLDGSRLLGIGAYAVVVQG